MRLTIASSSKRACARLYASSPACCVRIWKAPKPSRPSAITTSVTRISMCEKPAMFFLRDMLAVDAVAVMIIVDLNGRAARRADHEAALGRRSNLAGGQLQLIPRGRGQAAIAVERERHAGRRADGDFGAAHLASEDRAANHQIVAVGKCAIARGDSDYRIAFDGLTARIRHRGIKIEGRSLHALCRNHRHERGRSNCGKYGDYPNRDHQFRHGEAALAAHTRA